jgi:hypothetical protein
MTIMNRAAEPTDIFHYTNLEALCGILQTGQLWATHIKFMNDSDELTHGRDLLLSAVFGRLQSRADYDAVSLFVNIMFNDMVKDVFVACFSGLSDDLSQWRGYGGESGVSVGFARPPMCSPVSYSDHPDTQRVTKAADACFEAIEEFLSKFKLSSIDPADVESEVDPEVLAGLGHLRSTLHPNVFIPSVLVKHEAFAAEQEQRLVEVIPTDSLHSRMRFRVRRGALIPFVACSLGPRLPLTQITIGPGAHADLVREGVRLLLDTHGYHEIPVELSRLSYRP